MRVKYWSDGSTKDIEPRDLVLAEVDAVEARGELETLQARLDLLTRVVAELVQGLPVPAVRSIMGRCNFIHFT